MIVWLMVGAMGSGKSTYCKRNATEHDIVISRDAIRLSLLKDDEDYFAHEKLCLEIFLKTIQAAIDCGNYENIYVDATHLSEKSRELIWKNIKGDFMCGAVYFEIPYEVCVSRNAPRTGRAYVPNSVIQKACNKITNPLYDHRIYDRIIFVTEDD